MRRHGLSDQVRAMARDKYVLPALNSGKSSFSIAVRGMLEDLAPMNFPANSTPLVCKSLQSPRFLEENGLEIVEVDGPPSKLSTTVVVRYRVAREKQRDAPQSLPAVSETNAEKARRIFGGLRGILKKEIEQHGGAEGFLRWVREEGEEA